MGPVRRHRHLRRHHVHGHRRGPGALYDPATTEEPTYPAPAVDLTGKELAGIAETLGADLPGAQGAYGADGHVLVDVTYDDGSLQAWADEEYGENVVVVTSALVEAR